MDSMKHYSTYQSQFIEMFGDDKYPLIKLGDYTDLTWGDTNTTKNSYVQEGYLAFSASGPDGKLDHFDYDCEGVVLSAIGADCGKTWFASGKWSCIKNTIRFWSTSNELDNRFLYFATREKSFWPRRGGAQPFISQGDARNCFIILPPVSLQRKFVGISEQADKSKFTSLKSQFIEMFGGIQDGSRWPLKSLADLCDLVNGYAFKSTKYSDSGYSIIRIANVQKGIIDDSDKVYYPEVYKDEFLESILNEGDILVSLTGNVGRVGVIEQKHLPAALNQRVQGLRIKDESILNHQYLFSLLNLDDFENLCIKNATGSAQLNLSTIWLRNCRIVCPPIEDQIQFARIAHQADKSKYIN